MLRLGAAPLLFVTRPECLIIAKSQYPQIPCATNGLHARIGCHRIDVVKHRDMCR